MCFLAINNLSIYLSINQEKKVTSDRQDRLRIEINAVTDPVQNAPVAQPAKGNQIVMIDELADKLNYLGNCYGCRTCSERRYPFVIC